MKHKLVEAYTKVKVYIHGHKRESIAAGIIALILISTVVGMILLKSDEDVSRTEPAKETPHPAK